MNTIHFLTQIIDNHSSLPRNEYAICKALIDTLSVNELHKLTELTTNNWDISRYIEYRLAERKPEKKPQRNENWRIYLTNIQRRKKGTVVTSREKLIAMFPALEWKAQRQILWFFLAESTKTDRLWALKTIADDWGIIGDCKPQERKKWMDCIMNIWGEHHDFTSAKIIVKNSDYQTVAKNEEQLSKDLGYKHVALRLGESPDYVVQCDLMPSLDYLYVMAKLGRNVDTLTAETILSEVLLKLHDNPSMPSVEKNFLSLLCDSNVSLAIWCLGKLGHSELIQDFYLKDKQLTEMALKRGMSAEICWDVMCLNIPNAFTLVREHKQEIFDQLTNEHPALRTLVEKLQLQLK